MISKKKYLFNFLEVKFQKRSVNRKKSEEVIIEWVGPVKPKKEVHSEKQISISEGKESHKVNEKKPEFSNFEVNFEV